MYLRYTLINAPYHFRALSIPRGGGLSENKYGKTKAVTNYRSKFSSHGSEYTCFRLTRGTESGTYNQYYLVQEGFGLIFFYIIY